LDANATVSVDLEMLCLLYNRFGWGYWSTMWSASVWLGDSDM